MRLQLSFLQLKSQPSNKGSIEKSHKYIFEFIAIHFFIQTTSVLGAILRNLKRQSL